MFHTVVQQLTVGEVIAKSSTPRFFEIHYVSKRWCRSFCNNFTKVNRFWKFFTVGNSDELSTKYNV